MIALGNEESKYNRVISRGRDRSKSRSNGVGRGMDATEAEAGAEARVVEARAAGE